MCYILTFLVTGDKKSYKRNAAWGWEGFNQTKAPKTKNFKIAWLSLDFNISPSPRPLPLCGHSPAKRARHTDRGKSFFRPQFVAVILRKMFTFKGKSYFQRLSFWMRLRFLAESHSQTECSSFPLSAQACADKKRDVARREDQSLVSLAVAGATEGA